MKDNDREFSVICQEFSEMRGLTAGRP